jgi:hypothetical protein
MQSSILYIEKYAPYWEAGGGGHRNCHVWGKSWKEGKINKERKMWEKKEARGNINRKLKLQDKRYTKESKTKAWTVYEE